MSQSNKGVWWIIAGVIILILVIGFARKTDAPEASGQTIKIGLSLPLTGDLAYIGEADKNAAQIAFEEIQNDKNLKNKYELVYEDDAFTAAKASAAVQKFVSIDKVDALISIGSTAGNSVAPVAQNSKIPHIGMASDPNVAKGEYNFINWTRPQEEVDALITELKRRGITKVAMINVNQQGFTAVANDFKTKASAAGISYTEEVFNTGQKDFKTIISKLQQGNPDIYLINSFDPELGIIAKDMKNLGVKTPLTSVESFGISSDIKPFEGQWFVDAAVPTADFTKRYMDKFGKNPGPAAANTYDAIKLLVQAFEKTTTDNNKPTSEAVAKALSETNDYSGALGSLKAGPDGAFLSQATVKVVKDGQAVQQ